jgi:hypothetical protein
MDDNIKMNIKNSMEGVDSIHVAEDRVKRQALLKAAMNLRVPSNAGNFSTEKLLAPQEEFCCMKLDGKLKCRSTS